MSENLDSAFQMVGKFLFHFAHLEREVDLGLGKILGLAPGTLNAVAPNIDFSRKVRILLSAETVVAAKPDKARRNLLDQTWSAVMAMNELRVLAAHSSFGAHANGVVFRRSAANQKGVKVTEIVWTEDDLTGYITKIEETKVSVRRLIDEMKPFSPFLDFSDPRNSPYLALLL